MKSFEPFRIIYNGSLRPSLVTPMRTVPDDIPKPDYHLSGFPASEQEARASVEIPCYSPEQVKGIRAACRVRIFVW